MEINYKVKTNKSFIDAIESLRNGLSNKKFGVLWELNFKDKLKEKGLDFDKNFKILEVCNPVQAKEVLDKNIEVGFFLPCKVVVYEENKTVYIGMIKPTALIGMTDNSEITDVANEVENELMAAINNAV